MNPMPFVTYDEISAAVLAEYPQALPVMDKSLALCKGLAVQPSNRYPEAYAVCETPTANRNGRWHTVREQRCDCGAHGLCEHRVAAYLYQRMIERTVGSFIRSEVEVKF